MSHHQTLIRIYEKLECFDNVLNAENEFLIEKRGPEKLYLETTNKSIAFCIAIYNIRIRLLGDPILLDKWDEIP